MDKKALMEELEQLGKLHQAGVLSQAEFEAEKADLLGQLRALRGGQAPVLSKGGGGGAGQAHGADVLATGFAEDQGQTGFGVGSVVGERHRLVRKLGQGGMGEVWLAEDVRLGRVFALKFLADALVGSAEALGRMHREYEVLEKLSHPNIVRVFDMDQDQESGRWYLRMEYVEGEDLGKKLSEVSQQAKRPLFGMDVMVGWLGQLVEALEHAHQRGILHRDIKPANLMLATSGTLKVMDFGIARMVSGTHTTQHTAMMGSMYYAAPELLRGQSATLAADIYSFGVLAYEMLMGDLPMGRFALPSSVFGGFSERVDDALERMLQVNPKQRGESLREAWLPLRDALLVKAPAVVSPNPAPPSPKNEAISPPLQPASDLRLSALSVLSPEIDAFVSSFRPDLSLASPQIEAVMPPSQPNVPEPSTRQRQVAPNPTPLYAIDYDRSAGERRVFRLGGADFAMRWIPAGRFLMGAGVDDNKAFSDEHPQHEVTVTQGFWMGETPVTQEQYQTIMGKNPSYFQRVGVGAPVESVSWYDAAAFANHLSELEGLSACFVGTGEKMEGVGNKGSDYLGCKGWRLPTEAEWEHACRAGTTSPRYGDVDPIAWYRKNSGDHTCLVRQKQANAWGLYDMLGNVWEWCYDWYGGYPAQAATDPTGTAIGASCVSRGGSWDSDAHSVRAATRYIGTPTNRNYALGFRVVRSGRAGSAKASEG
ncbi:SUMF1/EgtB/PvdO family nonheme iron enzyme [Myxococcota bacterium]|nr:SUMF1/EgtB/PvdO family nonheme iron enzyme [Myxococcota bacterium]